jgi:hypothetical protein
VRSCSFFTYCAALLFLYLVYFWRPDILVGPA